MKKLIAAATIAIVACFMVFGWNHGLGNGEERDIINALAIDDGAEKYDQMQYRCPVCGKTGISADYYATVKGRRIYFDSQHCREKFKENPEQYLERYRKMTQEAMERSIQQRMRHNP